MSLLSILSRVTSDSRLRVEDRRERSTVSGMNIPRPTALMKRAELSGRPTALLGLVVATWQSRRIVRGSAEFVLVNQRGWFMDNDGSRNVVVVGSLYSKPYSECVCSHCLVGGYLLNFLFCFILFCFVYLYRVGSLDVGVDAQQPGAAVIPWEKWPLSWTREVMPDQGPTSGGPIHTTS